MQFGTLSRRTSEYNCNDRRILQTVIIMTLKLTQVLVSYLSMMIIFYAVGITDNVTRRTIAIKATDTVHMEESTTVPANATDTFFLLHRPRLELEYIVIELVDWSALDIYLTSISDYSSLPDDDETKQYIMNYSNEFNRKLIATQISYCPFEPLCSHSLNVIEEPPYHESCCTSCSCLPNCTEYGNCCLDMAIDTLDTDPDHRIKTCIPLHVNTDLTYSQFNIAAYGISKCPITSTYSDRYKCDQIHEQKDIRMVDLVPVIHVYTNTVFRNMHCALCNGESMNDLDFFKASLACRKNIPVDLQTDHELIKFVMGNQCDIGFRTDHKTEYCKYTISKCNMTKRWAVYDPDIETACSMYTSLIQVDSMTYFKNIFCALCNGYSDIARSCSAFIFLPTSEPFSFTGLLSLSATGGGGSNTERTCSTGFIYHKAKDDCIQAHCSPLGRLSGNKCVPVFDSAVAFNYQTILRLTPSIAHTISEAYLMTESLLLKIKQFLQMNLVEDPDELSICNANVMLKINTTCSHLNPKALLQQRLGYYIIRLYFSITATHHPENIVSYFSTGIVVDVGDDTGKENETIDVKVINGFEDDFEYGLNLFAGNIDYLFTSTNAVLDIINVTNIGNETTDVKELDNDDYDNPIYSIFPEPQRRQFCSSFDGSILIASFSTFDSVVKTCMLGEPDEYQSIATLLSCPMIRVSNDSYEWVIREDGVLFKQFDAVFINNTQFYIEPDNSSVLFLCTDTFFELSNEIIKTRWPLTVEHIVSIVCVSLSILSLLVTLVSFSFLAPLRRNLPGKNNMALISTLLIAQTLYLTGSYSRLEQGTVACKVVGILTHFSWLLVVFWMNVCTYHMFQVLTKTMVIPQNSGYKRYLKYHLYCFVCAIVFVSINIIASFVTSAYKDIGYGKDNCYISSQNMLMYTFGIPLALTIVSNITMFLIVIINVKSASAVQKNVRNERSNINILARLSTLTGATWVFGFLYTWTHVTAFSYVFIILNAGQGVFLFLSFICTRRVVRMASQAYTSTPFFSTTGLRQIPLNDSGRKRHSEKYFKD